MTQQEAHRCEICGEETTEQCEECGKWICPEHTSWRGSEGEGVTYCEDCAFNLDAEEDEEYFNSLYK